MPASLANMQDWKTVRTSLLRLNGRKNESCTEIEVALKKRSNRVWAGRRTSDRLETATDCFQGCYQYPVGSVTCVATQYDYSVIALMAALPDYGWGLPSPVC
jgi:hypothetical protein